MVPDNLCASNNDELFDKVFVTKKFYGSVKSMADDLNSDIRLIFVDSICLIANKLPFDIFEKEVLPKFILHLNSKHNFIRERSVSQLGHLICTISENFIKRKQLSGSNLIDQRNSKLTDIPNVLYGSSKSRKNSQMQAEEDISTQGKLF